ncbi:MAG: nucleotidyltransferase [Actinomycetota bacterium]|nr:nucleotidyltransferase [Actinomycetota bacterium]
MADKVTTARTREVSDKEADDFRSTLAHAVSVTENEGCPYLLAGSMASNVWGRPASIGDIDLVIRPDDAKRLLHTFETAGYETEEVEPQWLYKAKSNGVTVDLIFEMGGDLYLDDEMIEKGPMKEVEGTRLRLIGPEDYVVSQAMSTKEDTSDYWYNALAVLGRTDLDWDYLIRRASHGPRRVLSLLVYAQSEDLTVSNDAIRRLYEFLYEK